VSSPDVETETTMAGTDRARWDRDEQGVYAMLFVLLLGVFMMAAALAVDMGSLYFARNATQSVADMAAAAGGLALEPTAGGTASDGCQAAWEYTVTNLRDVPNNAPSPCATVAWPTDCSATTAPVTVNGTITDGSGDPLYRISITHPVPDGDPAMDARLTEPIDGDQCQRIGVSVERVNNLFFGGFMGGSDPIAVSSVSVARAQASETGGDLVALVVLERTNCGALTTDGQGHVIVEAVDVEVDDGTVVEVPGVITTDSDGSGSCGGSTPYVIHSSGNNVNNFIVAEGTADGAPGLIFSHALQGANAFRSHEPPPRCGPNNPSLTANRPVQPCPTSGNRLTRERIDHRYNCKPSYSGLGTNHPGIRPCPAAGPDTDHIDRLRSALGGTTPPANGAFISGTYDVWPTNPSDCSLNSAVDIDLGPGNWFINCPNQGGAGGPNYGFRMQNDSANFSAGPGEIVFAGGVNIQGGTFTIGDDSEQSIMYVRRSTSNQGHFAKSAHGVITLRNTFVYIHEGRLDVGAGSPPLTWVAPDDEDFPFDDLALWSDSTNQHELGGGAVLDIEGTFFTPNATPFRFRGQAAQAQTRAQFVTWRLEFAGQGGLRMQPDPERSTPFPIQGVRLIR
jgi:hypothetical protein